jgi:mycoredoxin-dependent peroxiredoxin
VFNEKAGMALRGTFLLDADGKVTFAEVNEPGDARQQSGWKDAVTQLAA